MISYADYMMIISLPDDVIKEFDRYKRASVNLIGHFEGMHSKANIIITRQTRCKPFLALPAIDKMANRLITMPPVELHINGFNFFNDSQTTKTIYAVIERNTKTENWFKLLLLQMGMKVKNFVPHVTIAQNIPLPCFNKLWPNFENRHWSKPFTANSLTVLHRETYVEYCEWLVYKELFFANRLKEMF
jgi:hypothetical protein